MVRLFLRALALGGFLWPFVSLGANAKPVVEAAVVFDATGSTMASVIEGAKRSFALTPRRTCLAVALEQCNARIARFIEPLKTRDQSDADRHQLTPAPSSGYFERAAEPTPRAQGKQ